jgi:adenylate kinase
VWKKLEAKYGREMMRFPKEMIFLMGAPGSGKGTNTPFILRERGITAPPIVMSDLLTSAEAERLKAGAMLVPDAIVVEIFMEKLLQSVYENGVVIDGFPRTPIQVEVIKLLHDKMKELQKEFTNTPAEKYMRRPMFRITVLFVDDFVSVQRQMQRGHMVKLHNEKVMRTGMGQVVIERETDKSEEAARARYAVFAKHYDTLTSLKKYFKFNIINASGSIEEVERSIIKEFRYQSEFELGEEAYAVVMKFPTSTEMGKHARQELVRRLDAYASDHRGMFHQVSYTLEREFLPAIRRHQLAGRCLVRTTSPLFKDTLAVEMAIDLLSERGYAVVWDQQIEHVPHPATAPFGNYYRTLEDGLCTHVFTIEWKKPVIRNDE